MYQSNVSFCPEQPLSGPDFFKRILIVLGLLLLVLLPDIFFGSQWHPRNLSLWILGVAGGLVVAQSVFRKVKVALTIDYGQELVILSSRTLLKRSEWVVDFRALALEYEPGSADKGARLTLSGSEQPPVVFKEGEDGFSARLLSAMNAKLVEVKSLY